MKYYIIAGEASGDLHGSNLMKGIYSEDPSAQIRFWGGDLMNTVCVQNQDTNGLVHHYKEGAIMGFWEVVAKAKSLLANLKRAKEDILNFNPDCVILIDYPGFNFKIAEFAHKHNFKVFYYIAPKVWASREGRIKKLKKYVDKLFIIFPFEIEYFEKKNLNFSYNGNPLVDAIEDSIAMTEPKESFLSRNLLINKPYIALLAGSRKGEINTMMPVLMDFVSKMRQIDRYKDMEFIIAGAPARSKEDYLKYIPENSGHIKLIFGQTQSIIKNASAAIVNSGTASLETVLLGTPQVVGFIMGSKITYAIAKLIIKVKYISLGNLIIDKYAFKEYLQNECNADNLIAEICKILEENNYREQMLSDYKQIRKMLGGKGASRKVAKAIISQISSSSI